MSWPASRSIWGRQLSGVQQDIALIARTVAAYEAVIMCDTRADDRAKGFLQDHFPTRDIVPVKIDTIAGGGGGIHCSTHDQPGQPAT